MKYIYLIAFCFLYGQPGFSQKLSRGDKKVLANLKTHINYLADDKLEGRRTGSAGEKIAYEYITAEFIKAGLAPANTGGNFLQDFEVNEGKQVNPQTSFSVNGQALELNKEFFPLAWSANGKVQCDVSQSLKETGEAWFFDINELLTTNAHNPHFDLQEALLKVVDGVAKKGASALIIYNSSAIDDNIKFEGKDRTPAAKIPVIYITATAKTKYLADEIGTNSLELVVDLSEKKRIGHNVIGYINNNAPTTIIIGAHYDHLGYGEDHTSLYSGTQPMIHNGADDNASGTAALIELAKMIRAASLKKSNYLFIAFSGEELGLYGSKYFTEHPTVSLNTVRYMINMDMVGRLNDSTHGLTIGGYGTSPSWGSLVDRNNTYFKVKIDSSGTGPSDHTSFYRKDIPVLFFFTGTHKDYHKPSDDADKINYTGEVMLLKYIYSIIRSSADMETIAFTKTREEVSSGKSSFKVSMGIMPDYTYSGNGVHVDGVSAGRPAEKAGIKTGDVIFQLGEYKFSDVQTYMNALNKFNKGDAVKVKLMRGNEELVLDLVF